MFLLIITEFCSDMFMKNRGPIIIIPCSVFDDEVFNMFNNVIIKMTKIIYKRIYNPQNMSYIPGF